MIEEHHISFLQMMEQAGRNLAQLAQRLLQDKPHDRSVVLLAGRGHKGGVGLIAAHHLLQAGAWVQVVLTRPPADHEVATAQTLANLQEMQALLAWAEEGWELPPADLVIDALLGDGLQGEPQGTARNLIQLANSSMAPILSLDAPSGLEAATGSFYTPHIHATVTMQLAWPKTALLQESVRIACGELFLADIGAPHALYVQLGFNGPPLFARDSLLPFGVEHSSAVVMLDDDER